MATHDYVIDNQTSASARSDINNVLQAIVTNNSGSSEPADTFANMFWYDTTNNFLKMRNEANSAWIIVGYVDQATGQFDIRTDVIQAASASGTTVKNSSGTLLLDLKPTPQATAEAGTNNTEIMTPLRVKNSIDANAVTVVASDLTGTNGYIKYNNGLLMQWGRKSFTSAGGTLNWNITFPNEVYMALGNDISNANGSSNLAGGTIGLTSWTGIDVGASATYAWIAIGD